MIPVLFTTYNRLAYTKQTLPTLLQNTQGRIIVIDNGSVDGTQEYLKGLTGFELVLNPKNKGLSGAMNQFFEMTKGVEFAGKVDNDTLVPPDWLKDLTVVLAHGLEIVQAAHYFWSSVYKDWEHLCKSRPVKTINGNVLVYMKSVGGSGIAFKREIVEHIPDTGLFGWSEFIAKNKQHRRGMYGGVWVNLLDLAYFNRYKEGLDAEYFVKTGRWAYRD